jgi:DNA replication protein DnaC
MASIPPARAPRGAKPTSPTLAVAACRAGFSVYFISIDDTSGTCSRPRRWARFATKLQTHLKPAVHGLDDVDYLPLSRAEANMLFQLVACLVTPPQR